MNEKAAGIDIAGESYWSGEWRGAFDRRPEDERLAGWRNHVTVRFDALFARIIPAGSGAATRLIEAGCARSRWLPYFARRFGAELAGLDYSAEGCRQAVEVLEFSHLKGDIVHGDLFDPPARLLGRADVVFSWGLAEHFTDTARVAGALQALARPGGVVITIVPNMRGLVGWMQRKINPEIYRLHVPIDREQLRAAFVAVSAQIVSCGYFMPCNFWVVNPGERRRGVRQRFWSFIYALGKLATVILWQTERMLGIHLPAIRWIAPYVVCISKRTV